MYKVDSKEYKGYTINVYYDESAEYNDCDHLGTFYTNTPRNLNPDNKEIDEILVETADGKRVISDDYIYVKVYAYIHSGIALSTSRGGCFSDPWDSGLGGIMAVSKEKAKKEYGYKVVSKSLREKVLKCLESEVKELDAYCKGNIYGFQTIDEDGDDVDSCWGFICIEGDMKDLYDEAESTIDWIIKENIRKEQKAAQDEYVSAFESAMNTREDCAA